MQLQQVATATAAGKGQLISKGLFGVIVSTKKTTMFFKDDFNGTSAKNVVNLKMTGMYCLYIGL